MKRIVKFFKKVIRFAVSIFASREFAFIYCLVGTVAQVTHTYFLTEAISSLSGNFKIAQAILISAFISSSLLYFVAIADDVKDEKTGKRTKESKRIFLAINIFMIIEILINFYYYSRHLIIDSPQLQIFDFIFAVMVSCLIPVTIKLYANSIRAKEWLEEFSEEKTDKDIFQEDNEYVHRLDAIEHDFDEFKDNIEKFGNSENYLETLFNQWLKEHNLDNHLPETLESDLKSLIADYVKAGTLLTPNILSDIIGEIKEGLDGDIATIFKKNQALFLQQFENKCQVYINKNIHGLKTEKKEPWDLKPSQAELDEKAEIAEVSTEKIDEVNTAIASDTKEN